MEKIIAKFEYNSKKIYISLVDKQNVDYYYFDEQNNRRNDFSKEEKYVISKVYKSLLINKEKSVKIRDLIVEGKKYEIFLDADSLNFYWFPNDNEKANIYLNFRYNNVEFAYHNITKNDNMIAHKDERKEKWFKKIISVGGKIRDIAKKSIIVVEVAATLALPMLSPNVALAYEVNYDLEQASEPQIVIEEQIDKPYNAEEIKNVIKENANLDDYFKDIYIAMIPDELPVELSDYHDRVELLKTLTVEYHNELNPQSAGITGVTSSMSSYNINVNTEQINYIREEAQSMDIYNATNVFSDLDTVLHEICHTAIFQHAHVSNVKITNDGNQYIVEKIYNFFLECANEAFSQEMTQYLFEKEYFSEDYFKDELGATTNFFSMGYNDLMPYYRQIVALLDDPKLIYDAKLNSNMDGIINRLVEIDKTDDSIENKIMKAKRFLISFEEIGKDWQENNGNIPEEAISSFNQQINAYYIYKTGRPANQNLDYILNGKSAFSKSTEENANNITDDSVAQRALEQLIRSKTCVCWDFSYTKLYKSLINNQKDDEIFVRGFEGDLVKITITDELRKQYLEYYKEYYKMELSKNRLSKDNVFVIAKNESVIEESENSNEMFEELNKGIENDIHIDDIEEER